MTSMNKRNWDIAAIRRDFPILDQEVNQHPLVYLDNAATTQKPCAVIDAISHYYRHDNANVHRGVHALSVRATAAYEAARETVRQFIHAKETRECIFVRGTTEAINLVAQSFVAPRIKAGEEILITHLEHHANIVPWQLVCEKTGARLVVVPVSPEGHVLPEAFERLLSDKTRFVALNYVSNALGLINPVEPLIAMAKARGIPVLLDGAQATAHLPIDVQALGCDFFAFSGHKMYGPTGIGVLWGQADLLETMPPYQGGGEMIRRVRFEHTEYAPIPFKFEAGTPPIAAAIGLAAAMEYLQSFNSADMLAYEAMLLTYAMDAIAPLPGFRCLGVGASKVPIISLVHDHIHAHDIGTILDDAGIAIRSGHHCTMPLMDFLGVAATARISLSFYNTTNDIDRCVAALQYVNEVFG